MNNTNITYRKATIHDIDELVRLRIDFLKEVQQVETRQYSEEELSLSLHEYLSKSMNNDEFVAWLAISDNVIVATSGLCFFQITPGFTLIDGKIAYILNIYTVPTWRGKGVAKQVFSHILQEAVSRGYKRISLHATDEGRPIYEKFGFRLTNDEMELRLI
ncbi:GNAT family N-acetyltransferase [Emticicia sp. SJ17W-69]|uniref:GNAT family N-acetyltransferase n=1 Tax=Emticicia sp. SJ17W-69 TaxID=3421657 RepID=UPI003EBB44BC